MVGTELIPANETVMYMTLFQNQHKAISSEQRKYICIIKTTSILTAAFETSHTSSDVCQ